MPFYVYAFASGIGADAVQTMQAPGITSPLYAKEESLRGNAWQILAGSEYVLIILTLRDPPRPGPAQRPGRAWRAVLPRAAVASASLQENLPPFTNILQWLWKRDRGGVEGGGVGGVKGGGGGGCGGWVGGVGGEKGGACWARGLGGYSLIVLL